ncbi:MAG: hypothetical protein C0501_28455 [Isosphaera sp.]|nr:hypothetical protein [Isosphaera sp.]
MVTTRLKVAAAAVLVAGLVGAGVWRATRTGDRPGPQPAAKPTATAPPADDLEFLQGGWHVESVRVEVESYHDHPTEVKTLTLDRNLKPAPVVEFVGTWLNAPYLYRVAQDGWKQADRMRCRLELPSRFAAEINPSKSPKQIDLFEDIGFCFPNKTLVGKGIYEFGPGGLTLAVGRERPAGFGGGPGVVEVRLTRFRPEETARADRRRELERARDRVLAGGTEWRDQGQRAAERVKQAAREFDLATQNLRAAEADLAAARQADGPPADTQAFTVHARTPHRPEQVVWRRAIGGETVLDGLALALARTGMDPDAMDVWVVRRGAVLPVDLADAPPAGGLAPGSPLEPGDQLFAQWRPGK